MTSGGNNFNYFPENQLTKFMYFPDRGYVHTTHPTHLVSTPLHTSLYCSVHLTFLQAFRMARPGSLWNFTHFLIPGYDYCCFRSAIHIALTQLYKLQSTCSKFFNIIFAVLIYCRFCVKMPIFYDNISKFSLTCMVG